VSDDLIERLKKPIEADRIYNWVVEKRKKHRSDFPRQGFQIEMELLDEERKEAADALETQAAELLTLRAERGGSPICDEAAEELHTMTLALHEISIIAENTISPDGPEAAYGALAEILRIIQPFRKYK